MDRPNRNDKHELHNGEIVTMYNNRTYTEALEKYASTLEEQLTSTDVSQQRELLVLEKKAYYAGWTHGDLDMGGNFEKWKNRTN